MRPTLTTGVKDGKRLKKIERNTRKLRDDEILFQYFSLLMVLIA